MRGWTQSDLAERYGTGVPHISKIENGHIRNLQLDTLFRLADALDVKPEWLLGGMT